MASLLLPLLMINPNVPDAGATWVLIGMGLASLVLARRLQLGRLIRPSKNGKASRPKPTDPT